MISIIPKRKIWYLISLSVIVICGVFVILRGFNLGIDFTGGSLLELKFEETPNIEALQKSIAAVQIQNPQIQLAEDKRVFLKLPPLEKEIHDHLSERIKEEVSSFEEVRFETVGAAVGRDLTRKAFWAMGLVLLGIIFYIAFAFRKVSSPVSSWFYGTAAILALIHDVLVSLIVFGAASLFFNWYADSFFITALLTVIGFSVHDTIVIFDRIRENLLLGGEKNFEDLVNFSINQTIMRSLITSSVILFTLMSLFFFGGASLKPFVFTLIVGMLAGTYSSIFLASPFLVDLNKWKAKKSLKNQ